MPRRMKIFDVSRPVSPREPVYPGNPKVRVTRLKTFAKDGSALSGISLGLHTGSHVDAPSHYVRGGRTVEKVPLSSCVGWARVVDMRQATRGAKNEINEKEVRRVKPQRGEIILFKTGNSRPAGRFKKNFVHLNEEAARELVKSGVKAVGIDGPSIRRFRLRPDTVHPLLLKNGIVVYEGLQFQNVVAGRYYFIGLPLKISGAEASPVRAVLINAGA